MTVGRRAKGAMTFFHPDHAHVAWRRAAAYAGAGGRLATAPDVVETRLASPYSGPAWVDYVTTVTSEFVGTTRGGIPVLAVMHGTGPLSTSDGLEVAYHRGRESGMDGGLVEDDVFHAVLDGAYGPVTVVDLLPSLTGTSPFVRVAGPEAAVTNPVLVARLGGPELASAYAARLGEMSRRLREAGHTHGDLLLDVGQPDDGYVFPVGTGSDVSAYSEPPEGFARAHLVSFGGMARSSSPDTGTRLCTDVSLHGRADAVRFMALPAGHEPGPVRGQPDMDPVAMARSPSFWRKVPDDVRAGGFHALVRIGDALFTQYPKDGCAADTKAPMHRVVDRGQVGLLLPVDVPVRGYHAFFRYDLDEVSRLAAAGANAYEIVGDVDLSPDGRTFQFDVVFRAVEVDGSARLLREDEVLDDPDLVAELADAA